MSRLKNRIYRGLSRICAALAPSRPPAGLRALMYHSVGSTLPDDPYGTSIGKELFREHMAHIASLRGTWELASFGKAAGTTPQLAVTFDDGYLDTLKTAAPILMEFGLPFTVFVISDALSQPGSLYLGEAELRELARLPGVSIGVHGKTHRRLTALGDEELAEELSSSRKRLEDLLGRGIESLSYPHGAVDRRVRGAAREAGYALGGTSRYGLNGADRDPLLLCRTEVTAWDSAEDLSLKIRGHWDWYRFRHADPAA